MTTTSPRNAPGPRAILGPNPRRWASSLLLLLMAACAERSASKFPSAAPPGALELRMTSAGLLADGVAVAKLDLSSKEQAPVEELTSALRRRGGGHAAERRVYRFDVSAGASNAAVWRVLRTAADSGWTLAELVHGDRALLLEVPAGSEPAKLPAIDRGVYVALGDRHTELVWLEDDAESSGALHLLEKRRAGKTLDSQSLEPCLDLRPACSKVSVDADPGAVFDRTFDILQRLGGAEPDSPLLVNLFLDDAIPDQTRPDRYQIAHRRLVRLPAPAVERVLSSALPRFERCYADGLARNRRLRGTVTIDFVIRRDGTAALAHASPLRAADSSDPGRGASRVGLRPALAPGELPDEVVRACVHWVVTTLAFPRPRGGSVYVSYPVKLGLD